MIRCINCGINVTKTQKHPIETETKDVHELIQKQTGLAEIPSDNFVCDACFWLLRQAAESPGSCIDTVGHKQVCILCGRSLGKRRAYTVTQLPTPEMKEIILDKITPRALRPTDQICRPCRSIIDCQTKTQDIPEVSNAMKNEETKSDEEHKQSENTCTFEINEKIDSSNSNRPSEPSSIVLSDYRRAPFSHSRCVFKNCHNEPRKVVSLSIRTRVFKDYKYYIPCKSLMCSYHWEGNFWEEFRNMEGYNTFTEEHIYDFMILSKQETPLDFENIDIMDEHVVQYWFGIGKDEFRNLLTEIPNLAQMRRGSTALAAFLLKLRNESDERIADLLQISRHILCRMLKEFKHLLEFSSSGMNNSKPA